MTNQNFLNSNRVKSDCRTKFFDVNSFNPKCCSLSSSCQKAIDLPPHRKTSPQTTNLLYIPYFQSDCSHQPSLSLSCPKLYCNKPVQVSLLRPKLSLFSLFDNHHPVIVDRCLPKALVISINTTDSIVIIFLFIVSPEFTLFFELIVSIPFS